MQKLIFSLVVGVAVMVGVSSCNKSVLPTNGGSSGNIGVPAPPPIIVETDPAVLTPFPSVNISPNIRGYYEALPARYNESNQKYPVIFFFHGGGQYGDGHSHLDTLLHDGIPRLLKDKKFPPSFTVPAGIFSFIVIMPQQVRAVQNYEIDSLVNYAMRKYRIDSSRVYFSGFSLGGRQATDYAAYKPSFMAAITAMAGMPQMTASLQGKCKAIADAKLPVWQFHAKNDSAWKYTESVSFVNHINSNNPAIPARLTLFDKGIERLNHNCWTEASDPNYRENGQNIYEWMLSYKR